MAALARALGAQLEARLKEALVQLGAKVRAARAEPDVDLVAEWRGRSHRLVLTTAREPRRALLEGALAAGILRALKAPRPVVVVVGTPALSEELLEHLRAFAAEYGQGVAWGAVDLEGHLELHAPGWEHAQPIHRTRRAESLAAPSFNLFSDLGQVMLKVLLTPRLPPEFRMRHPLLGIGEPKDFGEPLFRATQLARRASVSEPHASRFVVALREAGFLKDDTSLELIRVEELLERWQAALSNVPRRQVAARWLLPRSEAPQRLLAAIWAQNDKVPIHARYVFRVSHFEACRLLGFGHVHGVAPHIYVGALNEPLPIMTELKMTRCQPGEKADLFVQEAPFLNSVLTGMIEREGVPVTDIVQCWLDVSGHPARGAEMGDLLYRRVIKPYLVEGRHAR